MRTVQYRFLEVSRGVLDHRAQAVYRLHPDLNRGNGWIEYKVGDVRPIQEELADLRRWHPQCEWRGIEEEE